MSIRVTFDRSIFHGDNFRRLLSSPLLARCKSGKYSIYHSTVLIEETLDLVYTDKKDELPEQIKFLIDIGNGRWFKDPLEIWAGELAGKSKRDYLFMSRNEQAKLIHLLSNNETLNDTAGQVLEEKQAIKDKKQKIKDLLVEMRKAASARFPGGKLPSLNFQDYSETFIEGVGTEIIRMKIETDQGVEALLEKWKTNKSRYPYFTLYLRAITYVMYFAEVEQNASIDWNTLTDIYLLGVVKDLDLIVSDDQKFMRSAFHALYPSCKEYIRLDEFLSRM